MSVTIPANAIQLIDELLEDLQVLTRHGHKPQEVWREANSEELGYLHNSSVDLVKSLRELPYRWCLFDPFDWVYSLEHHVGWDCIAFSKDNFRGSYEPVEVPRAVKHVLLIGEKFIEPPFPYESLCEMKGLLLALRDRVVVRDSIAIHTETSHQEVQTPRARDETVAPSHDPKGVPDDNQNTSDNSVLCEGDNWRIRYDGREISVRDTDGIHYIAMLLSSPGQSIRASQMYARRKYEGEALPESMLKPMVEQEPQYDEQSLLQRSEISLDDLMDKRARNAVRKAIFEYKELLAEDAFDSPEEKVAHESKLRHLESQLSKATNRFGNRKITPTEDERCAQRVQKAIKSAISGIEDHHKELARHLSENVKCGAAPFYAAHVRWEVSDRPIG